MHIQEFFNGELDRLIKFLVYWNYQHSINPEVFPLVMAEGNEGEWDNAFEVFDPSCEEDQVPVEYQLEEVELDAIRKDLVHQLSIPDDLDWGYFIETTIRAKIRADCEGLNKEP